MTDSIDQGHVVNYRFTVKSDEGELLAQNADDGDACYLHGEGTSPAGLEQHMAGRKLGEKFSTTLSPEDGYGIHHEDRQIVANKKMFPPDAELAPGVRIFAEADGVTVPVCIVELKEEEVVLDLNHPLAGRTLHFDVEIVSIRAATEEEIAHGHPHEGDHTH